MNQTVDKAEIAKFEAMAEEWWDTNGKFKPLHQFNPVRIGYIREVIEDHIGMDDESIVQPLRGLSILDIGCGGGLISEPMARIGARVTGIDASDKNINIAKLHAKKEELDINYLAVTAEELLTRSKAIPKTTPKQFDVVLALEIIEHVADVPAFVESCAKLVKPGGLLFIATINRTPKSLLFAKIGAEYILRWMPIGTHDWRKFLRPSEIEDNALLHKLKPHGSTGMNYNPFNQEWSLTDDMQINYTLCFEKKK